MIHVDFFNPYTIKDTSKHMLNYNNANIALAQFLLRTV